MSPFPRKLLRSAIVRASKTKFYEARLEIPKTLSIAAWHKIPLTTKDDLRAQYPLGLLAVGMDQVKSYHESSGTTGSPISSFFSEKDWIDIYSRFLRSRVALSPGDMVFVKTPYALVTTAHQMHGAAQYAGATVVPADNRSHNMPYSRVLRLLRELPITVAWCLPTEAVTWAYLAKATGLDPAKDFPNLRAFVVAGESLSGARRDDISNLWGGKAVIEDYGSTETGSLAGECSARHLHIWNDRLYFEVLDESGRAFPTGTGSLVVTPLYREAMPMIRYNLEDQVRISASACICGSLAPRIEVFGRKISKTQGFYPRELEEVVYSAGSGVYFWRARTSDEAIEIEIHAERVNTRMLQNAVESRFSRRALVRVVPAAYFVNENWLTNEQPMTKPRYVYSAGEDWSRSVNYF